MMATGGGDCDVDDDGAAAATSDCAAAEDSGDCAIRDGGREGGGAGEHDECSFVVRFFGWGGWWCVVMDGM